MNYRLIVLFSVLTLAFGGCQNSGGLTQKVEQQQQTINELNTRIAKIELRLEQQQKELDSLRRNFSRVKEDVKKVQPKYIDGVLQEGSN